MGNFLPVLHHMQELIGLIDYVLNAQYIFPSHIDYNRCREEIAYALNDFGNRLCKREC